MKIVFLVTTYYPTYPAVSRCVANVAGELVSAGENVTVLCAGEKNESLIVNDQRIIKGTTKALITRRRAEESCKSPDFMTRIQGRIQLLMVRARSYMNMMISGTSIQNKIYGMYTELLETLEGPIDLLIPACTPFEGVYACYDYKRKNPSVFLMPYLFDMYAKSATLHRNSLNRAMKMRKNQHQEEKVFSSADAIIHMPSWSDYILHTYRDYIHKCYEAEHPLLTEFKVAGVNTDDADVTHGGKITVLFAGTLLKGYVDPKCLIKIIDRSFSDVELLFFCTGNAVHKLNQLSCAKKINGWVTRDDLHKSMQAANLFLSIGEKSGRQMTSKLFDYMSYGKPIIHFYFNDSDIGKKTLEKYPLSICIKVNGNSTMEREKLRQFIADNADKHISYDQVTALYATAQPRWTSDLMLSLVKKAGAQKR
jgi:hypothetical protein